MDNEYGVSPWMLLRVIGPISVLAPFVIAMIVTGPLLIYPIARWRSHREPAQDPQLGIKVALSYFGLMAFQVVLVGATVVLFAILANMSSDDRGAALRAGLGMVVPAGIVLAAHLVLLGRTNQNVFATPRRLFLGYNLIITGLLGFASIVFAFEALFSKGSSGDSGRLAAAGVLVYGGAWAACGWQFARLVLGGYSPGPPVEVIHPPAPPAAPSGPTLPSLGGGSYPPLDPK